MFFNGVGVMARRGWWRWSGCGWWVDLGYDEEPDDYNGMMGIAAWVMGIAAWLLNLKRAVVRGEYPSRQPSVLDPLRDLAVLLFIVLAIVVLKLLSWSKVLGSLCVLCVVIGGPAPGAVGGVASLPRSLGSSSSSMTSR